MTTSSPLRTTRSPASVELQTVEGHSTEEVLLTHNDCAYCLIVVKNLIISVSNHSTFVRGRTRHGLLGVVLGVSNEST